MTYHTTEPVESGTYWTNLGAVHRSAGRKFPHVKWWLGPLPNHETCVPSLDAALKIAFAEMWEADHHGNSERRELYEVVVILMDRYGSGERTPELLAEMKRVTEELAKQ